MATDTASRLRLLRERGALNQDEVARAVGVSLSTVSNWERGKQVPERPQLRALAEFYGVPWQWIKDGDGGVPAQDVPDVVARLARIESAVIEMRDAQQADRTAREPTNATRAELVQLIDLLREALPTPIPTTPTAPATGAERPQPRSAGSGSRAGRSKAR